MPSRGARLDDVRDVADPHRHSLQRLDDGLLDVVDRPDQADAAHVVGLLAEREPLAADVLVGVGERRRDLPERDALALAAGRGRPRRGTPWSRRRSS